MPVCPYQRPLMVCFFAPPQVWDAASGTENCTLRGHSDWVRSCAFSPDGKLIVSASDDKTLKVRAPAHAAGAAFACLCAPASGR